MRRLTAALLALLGLLALAGCSDGAGSRLLGRPRRRRDLATVDPATRDAMLAYLGAKNARLVRAAFSHDALRR